MDNDAIYGLLRNFTSPLVAITTRADDETNGMIANSAVRASLVPECPRVAFYCFKEHYSHELISESGQFCLHLLHRDQLEVVRALGFQSGRNSEKLNSVEHDESNNGLPVLSDAYAYFECDVINAMDAGPSTFFLGEATNVDRHQDYESKTILDSEYFRSHIPEHWKEDYRKNKEQFQNWARTHLGVNTDYSWPDGS